MWQALRDIVDDVKQSVGIEVPAVPDTSAVTDAAGQAGEAATSAATDAAGGAADAVTGVGETVSGVGEQITSKVSDFLGRLGG
jgi:hypothetical protein